MHDQEQIGQGTFYTGDCFEVMRDLPDGSLDMVLCDLPYGTTACKWDSVLSFDDLWHEYRRILKPNSAAVLCGAEPFSSALRMSNASWFKYDWIWHKSRALGFTNAKNKPMNKHEVISVFSDGTVANRSDRRMPYFPQGLVPYGKVVSGIKACKADGGGGHRFARASHKAQHVQEFTNYPTSVIEIPNEGRHLPPDPKTRRVIRVPDPHLYERGHGHPGQHGRQRHDRRRCRERRAPLDLHRA